MGMSRATSLALAFNLPTLFFSSPLVFFCLHLDSLCNTQRHSALSSLEFNPSLHSVPELISPPPACSSPSPKLSPSFESAHTPSSPSQGSAFFHSLSAIRNTRMQRRQHMRSRRGGSGRGKGGRSSSGSGPPLSARNKADIQHTDGNVAIFVFRSELNRPQVTATITVSFQEEASYEVTQIAGARRRQRKSTILDKPPQVTQRDIALPVKTSAATSHSDNSSSPTSNSDGSGREDTALKSSHSPSSSDFSVQKTKDKASGPDEGFSCPIMEENPPHNES